MRNGPSSGPGRCSARRASLPDGLPAAALLQVPGQDSKIHYALVPCHADGPGLELLPRCLESRRCHGSASWISLGTDTKLWERIDRWAR